MYSWLHFKFAGTFQMAMDSFAGFLLKNLGEACNIYVTEKLEYLGCNFLILPNFLPGIGESFNSETNFK